MTAAASTLARELRGALLGVLNGRLDADSLALSVFYVDEHASALASELQRRPSPNRSERPR